MRTAFIIVVLCDGGLVQSGFVSMLAGAIPDIKTSSVSQDLYYPFLSTWQCISIWAPGAFAFAAGKQGGGQGGSFL
jgi:hypothetical protein